MVTICTLYLYNFGEIPKKSKTNGMKKLFLFRDEKINIKKIDYYFTNAISRSSKAMSDCRRVGLEILKDGTNY